MISTRLNAGTVADGAVHDEVEFDVVVGGGEPEATGSEVGAAEDGG